jgi:hypothetical protein
MDLLKPILLSGGGRTGSTQIMTLLGTDSRTVFDRASPYENRYLTYFAKFALLMQHPGLLQFFQPQQLFELNYLGFGGYMPGADYVPDYSPYVYLPRGDWGSWLREIWRKFSADVQREMPQAAFYAEKAPVWLAPFLRQKLEQFTIYNFRDPRDIFLSSNAFMKKRNGLGFARVAGDTDRDHARHIAQAFLNVFDNYSSDCHREGTLLVRYEDYILDRAAVIGKIEKLAGLELKPTNEHFNSSHATTASSRQSVERWKREPIAPELLLLLEGLLHEEMTALGYPPSLGNGSRPAKMISFAPGQIRLSKIDHSSDGELQEDTDCALVHVRGPDFHIFLPVEAFGAGEVKEVWASLSGGAGTFCSLYWRRRDAGFGESSSMHVAHRPGPHWEMLSFPVHTHPEWRGTITGLRLDLFNSHLRPNRGSGRIRWVRLVD